MTLGRCLSVGLLLFSAELFHARSAEALKPLRIHYINVGQGGSTLIVGPNGTTILYDFGVVPGDRDLVPYLRDVVQLNPEDGVDYSMVSHNDKDHYFGFREFSDVYDVKIKNFSSGSTKKSPTILSHWQGPARETSAGAVEAIPVGLRISLGDGAEAVVAAANGKIIGSSDPIKIKDENDKSIVLFVHYRGFQYIIDGDLGSGPEVCTEHDTGQRSVQQFVAHALIAEGLMIEANGVDVLHIAHHGSESSTSAAYYNLMRPEVGLVSVGLNQGSFLHPRKDVVDRVLIGTARAACVSAPPLRKLFQTENGVEGCSETGCTSFTGRVLGDIALETDGRREYKITGSNRVHHAFDSKTMSREEVSFTFPLDEPETADFDEVEEMEDPEPCCRRCRAGVSKACGDACIREDRDCSVEPGCACQG